LEVSLKLCINKASILKLH